MAKKSTTDFIAELRADAAALRRDFRDVPTTGATLAAFRGARAMEECAELVESLTRENSDLHELLDDAESRVAYLRRRVVAEPAVDPRDLAGPDSKAPWDDGARGRWLSFFGNGPVDVPRERPMRPILDGEPE